MEKVNTTFDKLQIGDRFTVPSFPPKNDNELMGWTKTEKVIAKDDCGRRYSFITCLTVCVIKEQP